jgi:thiol:disulfide interchange protein
MKKILGFVLLALIYPAILVWRLLGFHWCQEETNTLLMSLPFAGASFAWLQAKLHHRKVHHDCEHKHEP